jgi:hypothetical protein
MLEHLRGNSHIEGLRRKELAEFVTIPLSENHPIVPISLRHELLSRFNAPHIYAGEPKMIVVRS